MDRKAMHKELKQNKKMLINTFDEKVLAQIGTTKKELEEVREHFKEKGVTDERMDMALEDYNIRKKLNIINKEADLHGELDKAIGFLGSLIEYTK